MIKNTDANGTELRGRVLDTANVVSKLATMEGSVTAQEAKDAIGRFRRLLLPIYMMLSERAMIGEPVPDDAPLFSFSGSGASDWTYTAEFRALMGDEREFLKEAGNDPNIRG